MSQLFLSLDFGRTNWRLAVDFPLGLNFRRLLGVSEESLDLHSREWCCIDGVIPGGTKIESPCMSRWKLVSGRTIVPALF